MTPEPEINSDNPFVPNNSVIKQVLRGIAPLVIASISSILSGGFFLIVGFRSLPYINAIGQRNIGISLILAIILLLLSAVFYSSWDVFKKVSVFLQSSLLTFFSCAYFIGINAVNISIFNFTLNTGLVGILLAFLIFFVNLNLFGKNQRKMYLIVPQMILFSLQTYSFINLVETDKTFLRAFTTDWINSVFTIDNNIWLVICAITVSLVSILSYNLLSIRKNITFSFIFAVLNLEVLFAIDNIAGLSYWYKTLMFLIYWDFLYNPLFTITHDIKDSSFRPKLIISTVYHVILLVVVIAGKPIFG